SGAITFTFSDVVANADTSRVTLKDAQGNAVPINISLTGEGKTVNVAPVSSLQQGKAYTLTINSDLTADNGNTLAVDIVRAFTTIPDNSGGTTDPEDQKSNIWLWVGLIAAVVIILVLLVTRRPAKA
ncbi:MAG: Ig-like domain-containing protein, partial [Clostridiales bacterium]|nr:Ig-like domain-containing protein [Clostridiales bacterium]